MGSAPSRTQRSQDGSASSGRSSPDLDQPDVQIRFVPARASSASGMNTLIELGRRANLTLNP